MNSLFLGFIFTMTLNSTAEEENPRTTNEFSIVQTWNLSERGPKLELSKRDGVVHLEFGQASTTPPVRKSVASKVTLYRLTIPDGNSVPPERIVWAENLCHQTEGGVSAPRDFVIARENDSMVGLAFIESGEIRFRKVDLEKRQEYPSDRQRVVLPLSIRELANTPDRVSFRLLGQLVSDASLAVGDLSLDSLSYENNVWSIVVAQQLGGKPIHNKFMLQRPDLDDKWTLVEQ